MTKIRVLIADDHTLFRRLLADMLADEEGIEVVEQAASGLEAVRKVREVRPDLVLMDLKMPGIDGIEATMAITNEMPGVAILMLTMCEEDADLLAAMKAGAKGYLLKSVEPADLIRAIQLITCGHAVIHPKMAGKLFRESASKPELAPVENARGCSGLTGREKDILGLLSQGASNKEIARALRITETTVKAHVHSILSKLHLFNRVQAAKWAMENGLAQQP